ncbi:MAG TPA: DNRLRE domain-containing protein [Candidatus Poseidoniales archaeon]|nr:DNRLRE domain-containing protein [Candidatus Poseidoniales archaeon]
MEAKPWRMGAPLAIVILLLLQVLAGVTPTPVELASKSEPSHASSTLVDNGDGTWTVSYRMDTAQDGALGDTRLDSGDAASPHGSDSWFEVGHQTNPSARFNGLLGLDLADVGFWTNATVVNASLDLSLDSQVGTTELQVWMILRDDWSIDEATWNLRRSGIGWEESGGMGNADSGGWMDHWTVEQNDTNVSLDVSRAIRIGQYHQINGMDARTGVLLTGDGFGLDAHVRFHANDATAVEDRPVWHITFRWSAPAALSSQPAWIDIHPKPLATVDADSPLDLTASIRSERGERIAAGVSWAVDRGAIDGGGRFTPGVAGFSQVNASGASITGTRDVWVRAGAALGLAMPDTEIGITVDDTINVQAHGFDQHGNPVPDLPISWSVSSGVITSEGRYTPSELGTHTVAASWGSHVVVANITVGVGAADRIIVPEGLVARAGVGTQIFVTVEDRLGNLLPLAAAAGLDWTVERGSIDSAGYYVGAETGVWQINITSGVGANGTGWITVGPGLVDWLEIIHPGRIVRADEVIPLDLRWHDRVGNNVSVLLPLENWSAENGNFRVGDGVVEWLPSEEGTWRISAAAEDEQTWIDVTVMNGEVARVWVDAEHDILSADDETVLLLQAEDAHGNRWPISAQWAMVESEVSNALITDAEGTRFGGGLAGFWTVEAVHSRPEGDLTASLTIEVRPGRLAQIVLEGDGTTISSDTSFNLSPLLTDADDNIIDDIQLNWTLDGVNQTQALRMSNGVWQPVTTGDHLIEAFAAGRTARARINVLQGAPHLIHLETDLAQDGSTRSGESFVILAFAEDLDGNRAPWAVNWQLPENSVEIQETSWLGQYEARGRGEGIWELEANDGTAWGRLTLQVRIGEPIALRIGQHSGGGSQGETVSLTVNLVDYGGNALPMQAANVEFETDVGRVSHDGGPYWLLHLDESGESQSVIVRYDDRQAETFVNVEATGIDRLTGSQGGRILLGGFAVVILLSGLLVLIIRRNNRGEAHWDAEYEWSDTDPPAEPIVTEVLPTTHTESSQMSRSDRRRLSHQRQQQRTQSLQEATEAMAEETVAKAGSGVLKAMSGTVQGQTGWYQTAAGESQYWKVDGDGGWNREG